MSISLSCADVQFFVFMRTVTDLSKDKIYAVFDMLDVDQSGLLDFDEFYLLLCILIAVRVSYTARAHTVCVIADSDCTSFHRTNRRRSSSTDIPGTIIPPVLCTPDIRTPLQDRV